MHHYVQYFIIHFASKNFFLFFILFFSLFFSWYVESGSELDVFLSDIWFFLCIVCITYVFPPPWEKELSNFSTRDRTHPFSMALGAEIYIISRFLVWYSIV